MGVAESEDAPDARDIAAHRGIHKAREERHRADMEQARLGILPRPGGGLEQLHHRADDVKDQDDERFLRRFEPEHEHTELNQHRADGDRVIAVKRRAFGPEEMRAEKKCEHQAAEKARPALLEAEDEEFEEPAARSWSERHRFQLDPHGVETRMAPNLDRKSTRLNSSH